MTADTDPVVGPGEDGRGDGRGDDDGDGREDSRGGRDDGHGSREDGHGGREAGGTVEGNPPVRRLEDWAAGRLRELAAEHGTPLYVVDRDRVRENCERLRAAFPGATVKYALKAHAGQAVLETVRAAGLGAECASAGEVARALAAGFPGEAVQYTAVNPPARDLDAVVERWREGADLAVTAGARDTLDRLRERGYDGRVLLRVNPGVGAGHHEKVRTGGDVTFGVPYDRALETLEVAAADFELVGLHAHAGSGIADDDLPAHREAVGRLGELARAAAAAGLDLEEVDVGGGFGVPYRAEEPPLDLPAVAAATREALGAVDARLAVEPGRYVVADAGVLLTRVNTVKPTADVTVAGVDAGMTALLRPALYDAHHAVRNLTGPDRSETGVTVAGPVCESADVLCADRPLPRPERGDLLAVGNAGAYGYEMASTYNSRPRPAEVALAGGEATLARRRERVEDLTLLEREARGGAGGAGETDAPGRKEGGASDAGGDDAPDREGADRPEPSRGGDRQ